jgi:hypothetical protein
MVESRKGNTMTNGLGDLPERVQIVEQKLDRLAASVDAGFAEQRAYTDFAFERLDSKIDAGFSRLDQKMDGGLSRLDQKMDGGFSRFDRKMEAGFARLDQKLDAAAGRLEQKVVTHNEKTDAGFAMIELRFARVERKIDLIIDLHIPKPPDKSASE